MTLGLQIILAGSTSLLFADEIPSPAETPEVAPVITDPVQVRRAANAPFVGVPIRTKVAQRFEMYSPRTE